MPGCFNSLYYNAFYVAQHLFLKKVFQMFADVKKTVYLSLMAFKKKWTQSIHNRGLIMNQFMLIFGNRIQT